LIPFKESLDDVDGVKGLMIKFEWFRPDLIALLSKLFDFV